MKIAVPVEDRDNQNAKPYSHFGSAPFFLIYETETEQVEILDNRNHKHEHGNCSPMDALADLQVKGIIVSGIGGRAIEQLTHLGITVYQSCCGSISENLKALVQGKLARFSVERCCGHHRQGGGCGGH